MNPFDWWRRWQDRRHQAEIKSRFRVMWIGLHATHPEIAAQKLSPEEWQAERDFWTWINS